MTEPLFWIQSLFSLHYISLPLPCGQEEQNGNEQTPCSLDISHLNQVETLPATSRVRLSPSGRWGGRPRPSSSDFLQPQLRCLWGCTLQKSVWEKVSRCFQRIQPIGLPTSPPALLHLMSPTPPKDWPAPGNQTRPCYPTAGKHLGKSGLPGSLPFPVQFSSYLPGRTPPLPIIPTPSHSAHQVLL